MNIVLGFAGQEAETNISKLLTSLNFIVGYDLPLKTAKSGDNQAVFGILQPSGFFPLEEPFYDVNQDNLCVLQGYFWYKMPFPKTSEESKRAISSAAIDLEKNHQLNMTENDGGLFNLITYSGKNRILTLCNDYSGIFPLYYSFASSGVYFSSHLSSLAKALNKSVDPISLIQHTAFHYTIGNRSLFQDIFRLNPGETMIYEMDRGKASFFQPQGYYANVTPYKNDMEAVDALFLDYMTGVSELTTPKKLRGLMLSGGFDSRLVAFGFHEKENPLVTVTLGDPGNYESGLAAKVASLIDAQLFLHTPIDDCQLSLSRIEEMFRIHENVNFPYMDSSAKILKDKGAETLSTGYGGETFLGGQAFSVLGQDWSNKERLKNALLRSMGFDIHFRDFINATNLDNFIGLVVSYHKKNLNSKKKIFNQDYQNNYFDFAVDNLESDVRKEISRYEVSSSGTVQQLCERFWLEHHVLKHFGKQEQILSNYLPLVLPILHHSFLVRCSNLSPDRKVDHGIYLKLVKKYFSEFKKIPTSNIPLPLSLPTPLLWASRAVRSIYDKHQVNRHFQSAGVNKSTRLGWTNFETWFRQGEFLNSAIDYIAPSLYDKTTLLNQLNRWINWQAKIFSGQDLLTYMTLSQFVK